MPSSNGSGSRGPWGSGPQPDLEEFLRRSQDKLGGLLPGNLGGRGIALIALAAIALWGFSGFFRVEPDELGVVMRFGKFQPPSINTIHVALLGVRGPLSRFDSSNQLEIESFRAGKAEEAIAVAVEAEA
jgi:hypothetical protein